MQKIINHVYSLKRPSAAVNTIALVIDSPHSGTCYPFNHRITAPPEALESTCDMFVDELWQGASAVNASLLAARFPRAYIDPNRAPDDIDPDLLAQPWGLPLTASAAGSRGMGLIRRLALPDVPMYSGKLPRAEVQLRLDQYYLPYHRMLQALLEDAHQRFGSVWHIDCHSMKSVGNAMNADAGAQRPDIVVSDRNGASADPAFTEWAAEELEQLGYRVQINDPYQGGHIVHHYGRPAEGRHSIQIEIKRSLYMHEGRREKNAGFDRLKADLDSFLGSAAGYIQEQLTREMA